MRRERPVLICWSCEKAAGDDVLCAACGAVQPADPDADHFEVLGAERTYAVDLEALERRYKELTKLLHPDKYARADARARRFSLQRSVQLNDAWRVLREPVKRAEYLLRLRGIEVGGEEGTTRKGPDGTTVRMPVPDRLLFEVMDLREALVEARLSGKREKVAALETDVRGRRDRALALVGEEFAREEPKLDTIAGELVAVRYWRRFLDEVAAQEEATVHGG